MSRGGGGEREERGWKVKETMTSEAKIWVVTFNFMLQLSRNRSFHLCYSFRVRFLRCPWIKCCAFANFAGNMCQVVSIWKQIISTVLSILALFIYTSRCSVIWEQRVKNRRSMRGYSKLYNPIVNRILLYLAFKIFVLFSGFKILRFEHSAQAYASSHYHGENPTSRRISASLRNVRHIDYMIRSHRGQRAHTGTLHLT